MSAPVTQQQRTPSPELFFETVTAYQRTRALNAALALDFFTAIAEGNDAPAALARRCKVSERGARILADYLTVIGFLEKESMRYKLTPDSAMFLDRRSPACLASATVFMNSTMVMDYFNDVAGAVRKGGTVASEHGTVGPNNPVWVDFAKGMAPLMAFPAELIAQRLGAEKSEPWKVLDIAAGHGLFGITLAKQNPKAEIVALDWPAVLELAKDNAKKAGVEGRYRTLPGSAFEVDFGSGYDIVLLTNFLHHFDVPTCEGLLRKVHAALKPGGRAATLEFVPNEDRVTPTVSAAFALTMLATTPAGDAYTFRELEAMFRNAGFAASEMHALAPTFQQLVISKK